MPDLFGIDLQDTEPMGDFAPIPTDEYECMIQESELKETKNGDNYISLQFVILDGPFKDRILFENLLLWHPNETTQKIAKQKLLSIQLACGFTENVESTETLHNIPMVLKVKSVPDGMNKKNVFVEAHNKITAFKLIEGGAQKPVNNAPRPNPKQGTANPQQAAAVMDEDEPPWG